MGNHGKDREDREVEEVREVVEGEVFVISYAYNSSIGTYTYIKNYDEKYLEKVNYTSHYHGKKGMTGCNSSGSAYFKAKKLGTTKIILGHEYRGRKKGNTSIKVKIKKNDGKTPIEKVEYKIVKQLRKEIPYKISFIGDAKVGKTSLIDHLDGKDFNDIYTQSNTACYINKKITYENEEIELMIWNTVSNEKLRILNKFFYKDSDIIIFVYDITNTDSFENIKNIWYKDVQQYCEKKPMIFILGNKSDLYEREVVGEIETRKYAESINSKLKIVSAKYGFPVDNFLKELIEDYLKSDQYNY